MDSFALARIFFSLLIVVALILACAWLARRNGISGMRSAKSNLSISAKMSVGPRGMQIMIVDVEDARLVVGVTPGGISVLHQLPPQAEVPESIAGANPQMASANFQSIFRNLLRPNANAK